MASAGGLSVGIDLGTTYSLVAIFRPQSSGVEIIPDANGARLTPSVVSYTDDEVLVGSRAQDARTTNPKNTVYQVKRFMGKAASDDFLVSNVWPFEIVSEHDGQAQIRVLHQKAPRQLRPEEISAEILKHMKSIAEDYLSGGKVANAVITVPANFDDAQRQATKKAGELAGLNVLRILNEPTAAALACANRNFCPEEKVILVYDLGGGTFDVSIVRMNGMRADVLATEGAMELGGEDFTKRLRDEANAIFVDRGSTVDDEWELVRSMEQAKRELSKKDYTTVVVSCDGGRKMDQRLSRDLFNELCTDLFTSTISCIEAALMKAKLTKKQLDEIVLVGGSTRIPKVRELIEEFFPGQKVVYDEGHVDDAVAHGAALLAHALSGNAVAAAPSRPRAEVRPQQSQRPVSSQPSSSTPSASLRTNGLNTSPRNMSSPVTRIPDAPMLISVVDVTPYSLGIELRDKTMQVVIPKNTRIPTTEVLTGLRNSVDFEDHIILTIYEGQNLLAAQNRLLGRFNIDVPKRRTGENRIRVTFTINLNGILEVTAMDEQTRKTASITITRGNLTTTGAGGGAASNGPPLSKGSCKNKDRLEQAILRLDKLARSGGYRAAEHRALAREVREWMAMNAAAGKKQFDRQVSKVEGYLRTVDC